MPPTTSAYVLEDWSAQWCWQARIAIWESEQDQLRREEHKRLLEQQAKEDHALARAEGTRALSVVGVGLSALVNKDGTLRREVTSRGRAAGQGHHRLPALCLRHHPG
jgi:hypothetical protein